MGISVQAFRSVVRIGIMGGWLSHRSECGGSRTRTRSRAFVRNPRCAASSATRRPASLLWFGAQKNSLRQLRSSAVRMVRPAYTEGARSVLWGPARVPRVRGPTDSVQELRHREARAARVSGRQPLLYQALCLLRGAALPFGNDQGYCGGTEAGLGYGQDAGEAVHDGAIGQGGHTRTEGHWCRRTLDAQRPELPHRGERPDPRTPDLVWRRRPLGSEHGPVL